MAQRELRTGFQAMQVMHSPGLLSSGQCQSRLRSAVRSDVTGGCSPPASLLSGSPLGSSLSSGRPCSCIIFQAVCLLFLTHNSVDEYTSVAGCKVGVHLNEPELPCVAQTGDQQQRVLRAKHTSWQKSSCRICAAWPAQASSLSMASRSPDKLGSAVLGAREAAADRGHSRRRCCACWASPL